jgi:PAS domain S-box-containing protein
MTDPSILAIECLVRENVAVVAPPRQCCDLRGMKCLETRWDLIICVLVLAVSSQLSFGATTSPSKTVTMLCSFTDHNVQEDLRILKSTTRNGVGIPVDFQVEYLGSTRFDAPGYEKAVSQSLDSVYGGKKIDLVIATFYPALRLAVDHRRLRRWNIPESALPTATIISYRQPTTWAHYAKYVVAALALILVQATLIIGLLLQRARSRKANLHLRESEERFRLMADTTPALVWMCDKEGNVTYLNDRRIDFTGGDVAVGLEDVWSAFIHPSDLQSVRTGIAHALQEKKGFSREYRLRRRDGVYRWMLDIAAPRINGQGSFVGFIGSAADITDQKVAREALESIGGKLIKAQEEERSRISRELHDDICQRLALLSMELEQVTREANGSGRSPKIEETRRHCAEIAVAVQALSHKLHSSKLEYLGIVAAIKSFCHEFCQQHEVRVEFADENVPDFLPPDISLSLFRVTQEALQNALKHSGMRQFSVSLRRSANEIQLEVSDEGAGFNVESAKGDKGLGLVSMRERVHLVHGIFTIKSTVNSGTRIVVRVPLVTEMKASATAAESA